MPSSNREAMQSDPEARLGAQHSIPPYHPTPISLSLREAELTRMRGLLAEHVSDADVYAVELAHHRRLHAHAEAQPSPQSHSR